MGRLRKKGNAGAAKAYITRTSAVKKLQCSLADFRRLCILKGIFPREPLHRKRANKGSSAPTSFYYTKDIQYLAHEPVLKKLREHKAFAKKLTRALGRNEWSIAKNLEANKPVYTIDHVIKERYPTFIDALRDIDDALCMVSLFASLPTNERIPSSLTQNCARLTAEWQLYVMHTRSLRKVFLSIKGVYYQAETMGQTVTWLVPYQFAQSIPPDVDARVMLTFLELYQTLLGFVFFKLFTDEGLVYPPPMDVTKDDAAAGVGAFSLQDSASKPSAGLESQPREIQVDGKKVTVKDVRQTIKSITASTAGATVVDEIAQARDAVPDANAAAGDEEFVPQPSKSNPAELAELPTLSSISVLPQSTSTKLFAPYTFFLSRECPRTILEFAIRSFGGRVGWPPSLGSGSPVEESDPSITHVIIDRPLVAKTDETDEQRALRRSRKHVQPQWVVDCVNKSRVLLEEPYEQGKTLPPHLSPFGETRDAYDPEAPVEEDAEDEGAEEEDAEDEEEQAASDAEVKPAEPPSLKKVITTDDADLLRAAEVEAEAAGIDYATFEKEASKVARKKGKGKKTSDENDAASEQEMNKMMMSNKKRKLYEKMKFGERKRAAEKTELENKRRDLIRTEKRAKRMGK